MRAQNAGLATLSFNFFGLRRYDAAYFICMSFNSKNVAFVLKFMFVALYVTNKVKSPFKEKNFRNFVQR
jgi:hypothetical protein